MSALVAADVTYTAQGRASKNDAGKRSCIIKIQFGDGSKTYPAGGVPLSGLSAQGFPTAVDSIVLVDAASANGFVYKVDLANLKLRIYQGDNDNVADAPLIELTGSAAPAAASLYAVVAGY